MKYLSLVATLSVGFTLLGTARGQTNAPGNIQRAQPNWFIELLHERSKAEMMINPHASSTGSTYVPIDYWIYPALDRLQALGYIDFAYRGFRPWTRSSIANMLDQTERRIDSASDDEEAREIYLAVRKEIDLGTHDFAYLLHPLNNVESVYSRLGGIAAIPLNDSFHLGQTIVNDYGRPYQEGFNPKAGFSTRSEAGGFALNFRGECQHTPAVFSLMTCFPYCLGTSFTLLRLL